jgi:hypothetical protein
MFCELSDLEAVEGVLQADEGKDFGSCQRGLANYFGIGL